MKRNAYAKINLTLDVTGKRSVGYHELKMIMQSIELFDEVEMEITESGIIVETDTEFLPSDQTNIAYRAAEEFFKKTGKNDGCRIYIKKNIPLSAGLAGGSTDGAAVLMMLNEHYGNLLNHEEMIETAKKVGADVPFCLHGGTALCEGIGEKITQLKDFKDHTLVLVKPPFGVSTKEVFQKLNLERIKIHPETELIMEKIRENDLEGVSGLLKNLLENVTANKHKVIKRIKQDFIDKGAIGSVMSGSGPSVYGFFKDDKTADRAKKHFSEKYRNVFKIKTVGKY